MSYISDLQSNNTDLQTILNMVNTLPDGVSTVSINIDVTAGSGYYINSEGTITSLASGTIDAVAGLCFVYNPGHSVRPFHPNGDWHDEAYKTGLGSCAFYQFTEDGSELQLSDEPM